MNIGADVVYSWKDDPEVHLHGYISFADWEDNADADAFGVPDLEIFFYVPEAEFKDLLDQEGAEDFWVRSFEYRLANGGG